MALCLGVRSRSLYDFAGTPNLKAVNRSNSSIRLGNLHLVAGGSCIRNHSSIIKCLASRENVSELESVENAGVSYWEEDDDDDFSHVIKFKMSDFKIHDRVSIGLKDRGDELVYEATVKEANSPLFNTRVVLRQLISPRAKRRGKRAIEVLKRLSRQRLMYHSYSMQVHGYVCSPTTSDSGSFVLVHGYHGSYSLRHWFQQSDWLPTLEATLALDEESVRKVGDDTVGGPAVSRQLRLIRILMRDLLIGVNYLHSHGLAHTELRLENLHISPVDRHIKVGILGSAADLHDCSPEDNKLENYFDRRKMMIAFDMRCVGYIMSKMVLRDLMDPTIFAKFKAFLSKGNDPSCLREFLMLIIGRNSSPENLGFQILDKNWGAGWNLLSLLLATKPSQRISCLEALRHPFLCGPRWRVDPKMDMIRWSLGSTAVRITEEYIYGRQQRRRIAHFIELMEMLNPYSKPKHWVELLPGNWRLLYSTGQQIGLTLRQPSTRVLIRDVRLKISKLAKPHATFSIESDVSFRVMQGRDWAHDKAGTEGKLHVESLFKLRAGRRLYIKEEEAAPKIRSTTTPDVRDSVMAKLSSKKWRKIVPIKEFPSTLPVAKLAAASDVEISMRLEEPLSREVETARGVIREAMLQLPPELFDVSKIVCGTYVDSRLVVLRSVNGSALLLARSFVNEVGSS
ncbi:probable plastid-lipid-associated protein 14, chloroplastic [Andrographis paniculata]|uniref:probable plastid-lipid-associated protein 14, chloroplastic n=1 Tax=Andrographis paniculata TaxID=175694 RepID=UPI0021E81C28|nr:probable plastid-lipid-associated protein 14, chloroplastic [Andrographis paniculata]XP_051137956.1 probable plastid-lipid-associated protein 14, chloroplastic [Andrographis paniculata]